jgi:hypothetical protein
MVGDIGGFGGAVMEFTKVYNCGVNVFKLPGLLGEMKEGKGGLKECLDPGSWWAGKGKRGLFDERKMIDIVDVLSLI